MVEKWRNAVFSMIRVSAESNSRPVKAADAESGGQRNQKLHVAVRKAHFEVKCQKTAVLGPRSTFCSSDVEKLHVAVARSTFRSENVKNEGAGALF